MAYKGHIVVVEDDDLLRKAIVNCYKKNNYLISDFSCSEGVLEYIERHSIDPKNSVDIIVTDIVMPNQNGYELIASLKDKPSLGKIFISVNGAIEDKIKGLRLGADDYIVKPIDSTELLLRTDTLLSRLTPKAIEEDVFRDIQFLNFKVNPESRLLQSANKVLELGPTEHELLLILIGQQGRVCNKQNIAKSLYASSDDATNRAIDKLVSRLRKKLNDVGGRDDYIITQRGQGYLLVSNV